MRERTGRDGRTQRAGLVKLVKETWPKREKLPRSQVFWPGQRVGALWTTLGGQKGNAAWQKKFKPVGRARGAYGHEAQIVSYDEERECYRVLYLKDMTENLNVPADYIRPDLSAE